MTYVIVGGGIAGTTVAQTLIEEDSSADVVIYGAETHPLYSRMLLKEFAKGAVPEEAIRIHDESWYDRKGIQLRSGTRVVGTENDTVVLDDGTSEPYDTLFVTAGGSPRNPFEEVTVLDNVHGMWNLDQTRAIRHRISMGEMERAVVIGAGFLGLELADALAVQGVETHFVMRAYWSRHGLSREGADIVHEALRSHGVHLHAEQSVEEFHVEDGRCVAVETSEKQLPCDFVGLAVGVAPNVDFLEGTNVHVNQGVVVDEHLQSDDPNVYAAGDIAEYYDVYLERYHRTGTWLSAIDQAREAAEHALGKPSRYQSVDGHSVAVGGLDAPVIFLGHWDGGDDSVDKRYGDTVYRRIAFENDRPIGASLIGESGDVVGQLKQLIKLGPSLTDEEKQSLLAPRIAHTAVS